MLQTMTKSAALGTAVLAGVLGCSSERSQPAAEDDSRTTQGTDHQSPTVAIEGDAAGTLAGCPAEFSGHQSPSALIETEGASLAFSDDKVMFVGPPGESGIDPAQQLIHFGPIQSAQPLGILEGFQVGNAEIAAGPDGFVVVFSPAGPTKSGARSLSEMIRVDLDGNKVWERPVDASFPDVVGDTVTVSYGINKELAFDWATGEPLPTVNSDEPTTAPAVYYNLSADYIDIHASAPSDNYTVTIGSWKVTLQGRTLVGSSGDGEGWTRDVPAGTEVVSCGKYLYTLERDTLVVTDPATGEQLSRSGAVPSGALLAVVPYGAVFSDLGRNLTTWMW